MGNFWEVLEGIVYKKLEHISLRSHLTLLYTYVAM